MNGPDLASSAEQQIPEKINPDELPLAYRSHYPGNFYKVAESTYQVRNDGSWKKIKEDRLTSSERRKLKRASKV